MSTEIKLIIDIKNGHPLTDINLTLKMSEAEELYNKLKDIFDKPKKDLHNPHQIFNRDGDAPRPRNPFHSYGTIPCHTGTPIKFDDMTITCRVEGSGTSSDV